MRVLKVNNEHSIEEVKENIRKYKGYNDLFDWKIIQAVKMNPGIEAKTVSQVMCVSVHKVYSVIEKYNKLGKTYKEGSQWGGRREENSYLSIKEEKAFLERLTQKSIMGLIISAKDIKEELEEMLNHSVSEDYIWRVFKRHQWTKKTPRPEHPKTDVEAQEEFKKNSKRTWQPPR